MNGKHFITREFHFSGFNSKLLNTNIYTLNTDCKNVKKLIVCIPLKYYLW